MGEIGIDRLQIRLDRLQLQQRLAHSDERGDAVRRQVEAANQLLPTRLGGDVKLKQRLGRRIGAVGVDRLFLGAPHSARSG